MTFAFNLKRFKVISLKKRYDISAFLTPYERSFEAISNVLAPVFEKLKFPVSVTSAV